MFQKFIVVLLLKYLRMLILLRNSYKYIKIIVLDLKKINFKEIIILLLLLLIYEESLKNRRRKERRYANPLNLLFTDMRDVLN